MIAPKQDDTECVCCESRATHEIATARNHSDKLGPQTEIKRDHGECLAAALEFTKIADNETTTWADPTKKNVLTCDLGAEGIAFLKQEDLLAGSTRISF